MVLRVRSFVEHVRHWRRLPRLPSPVARNPVPLLQPMVAAFGLVCKLNGSLLRPALEEGIDGCFNPLKGLVGTWSGLQFSVAINQEDSRIPRNVSI